MIDPRDVDTLDNFKRQTKTQIERMHSNGRPHLLTVNGKGSLVVQDAETYAREMAERDRWAFLAAVKEALGESARGEGEDVDTVFDELEREMDAPPARARASSRQRKAS